MLPEALSSPLSVQIANVETVDGRRYQGTQLQLGLLLNQLSAHWSRERNMGNSSDCSGCEHPMEIFHRLILVG